MHSLSWYLDVWPSTCHEVSPTVAHPSTKYISLHLQTARDASIRRSSPLCDVLKSHDPSSFLHDGGTHSQLGILSRNAWAVSTTHRKQMGVSNFWSPSNYQTSRDEFVVKRSWRHPLSSVVGCLLFEDQSQGLMVSVMALCCSLEVNHEMNLLLTASEYVDKE